MEEIEKINRVILCIDLRSFYASVECHERGLDPFKTPLVVADESRGGGSVILAVTPYLKSKGVRSASRIYEIPPNLDVIYAKPRMALYLEKSSRIIGIYLKYIAKEDLHVYSVDECFLDITNYLTLYKKDPVQIAFEIMEHILIQEGLSATCGIGPNMLLAKIALDVEAKKKSSGLAQWTYDDVETKLWPITPLSSFWGIGKRMEIRLNNLGIFKMEDLAKYDSKVLEKKLGVIGLELQHHANGIDTSIISESTYHPKSSSLSVGQTLFEDYNREMIVVVIKEMCEELCRRLRKAQKQGIVVSLSIGFSKEVGGGFSGQKKLGAHTQDPKLILDTLFKIFYERYYDEPIRRVNMSIGGLINNDYFQPSIFENGNEVIKRIKLEQTIDQIKTKYGKKSIARASSLTRGATMKHRSDLIGGHNAE